tara:strand:- start:75509 stop:76249 length:741 start_codon:yes stop_codon:yes gene_type:complete
MKNQTTTTAPKASTKPEVKMSDAELDAMLADEFKGEEGAESNNEMTEATPHEAAAPKPPAKKSKMGAKKAAKKAAKSGEKEEAAPAAPKEPKVARITVMNAKRSEVALDRMGPNASDFVLEIDDAKLKPAQRKAKTDALLASINDLPVKVSEKAINMIAFASGSAKLSVYTHLAITFLQKEKEITAKTLIEHLMDQKANGVKAYSKGTANSQGHQMFKLLPLFKIGTIKDKTITFNAGSVIAAIVK